MVSNGGNQKHAAEACFPIAFVDYVYKCIVLRFLRDGNMNTTCSENLKLFCFRIRYRTALSAFLLSCGRPLGCRNLRSVFYAWPLPPSAFEMGVTFPRILLSDLKILAPFCHLSVQIFRFQIYSALMQKTAYCCEHHLISAYLRSIYLPFFHETHMASRFERT
jgi:hypothetical protein